MKVGSLSMHSPKHLHSVNTALILPLLGSGSILLLSSEMTSIQTTCSHIHCIHSQPRFHDTVPSGNFK